MGIVVNMDFSSLFVLNIVGILMISLSFSKVNNDCIAKSYSFFTLFSHEI